MPKAIYEPNLLGFYCHEGSALHTFIDIVRDGFIHGIKRKIGGRLRDGARDETQTIRRTLDAPRYLLNNSLANRAFGQVGKVSYEENDMLLLVEGTFKGDNDIRSALLFNIKPFEVYGRDVGNNTIDEVITTEKTQEFINAHRAELSQQGYKEFEVECSRLIYLRRSDLEGYLNHKGELDSRKVKSLAPLLVPCEYAGLEKVDNYSLEEHMRSAPLHVSSRFKKSVVSSLEDKLTAAEGNITISGDYGGKKQSMVCDWDGIRIIANSIDEVKMWQEFLEGSPTIGRFKVKPITLKDGSNYVKDYYKHPGGSAGGTDYKAIKMVVEVTGPGYDPSVVEIQIIDKEQNWRNEYESGKTGHNAHKKKREQVPKKVSDVAEYFRGHLVGIFGPDRMTIPIEL